MLGLALDIWRLKGSTAVAISGAATLAAGESDALAFDFTDDFWQASTSHYGSAYILDSGTPANNFDSSPVQEASSLLTYTSPSLKMTMGPSGTLRFQAHNLYLNSASPANQAITVVSGATYSVTITGSVSTTASGAATGTWTSGTTTFTAATTTLTLGSTSGTGTVHVRRTPSDSTYLATTSAARYGLPYEWDASGNLLGIRVEEARTNLCLYSDDLTNAAWTKANLTTAKTATGPDGVANSATTCTATAANATATQAITSASAARITHVWLKRRTGTGNIDLTQDNGATWTTQAITTSWARYALTSVTSANPTIGVRVVTSGDAVDVALFQHEVGSFATSPVPTIASTVTRAADNLSLATSAFPWSDSVGSFFLKYQTVAKSTGDYVLRFLGAGNSGTIAHVGGDIRHLRVYNAASTEIASIDAGTITVDSDTTIAAAFQTDDFAASLNGGSVVTDTAGTVDGSPTSMAIPSATTYRYLIKQILVVPRRVSDANLPTFGS